MKLTLNLKTTELIEYKSMPKKMAIVGATSSINYQERQKQPVRLDPPTIL